MEQSFRKCKDSDLDVLACHATREADARIHVTYL